MDKKWHNLLVILLLIIIVAALIYFILPNVQNFGKKSLDDGYAVLLNVFESNDVNIENVQNLELVGMRADTREVKWVESKENLLKVKSSLVSFKGNLDEYSAENKSELSDAASIYIYAIDFAFNEEQRMKNISALLVGNGVNCTNYEYLKDVNAISTLSYNDLYSLSVLVDDFAYKYDPYSELLFIDLVDEYDYLKSVNTLYDDTKAYCMEESA
jgi:hypothetical protein